MEFGRYAGEWFRFDLQRFADAAGGGEPGAEPAAGGGDEPQDQDIQTQEGDQGVGGDYVPKAQYDEAMAEVRELRSRLDQLTSMMMSPEYLQALRGEPSQAPDTQPELPEEPEPDFSQMSPKELVDWVVQKVEARIAPRVQQLTQSQELLQAQAEIQAAKEKYPDFMQYRDQMIAIARQFEARGVRITAEEAYLMAKGRAALKAAQQATGTSKASAAIPVAPPKPNPANRPPASGEKPGTSPVAVQKGQLSAWEAAEEAWKRAGLDKRFGG